MVIEKEMSKLLNQLTSGKTANVNIDGFTVSIQIVNHSFINFSTLVWSSNNYIPSSVRKCVQGPPPFPPQHLNTTLETNENIYSIILHYQGRFSNISNSNLRFIIEEFVWQAEQWRLYLDEHDKYDLVHIKVR